MQFSKNMDLLSTNAAYLHLSVLVRLLQIKWVLRGQGNGSKSVDYTVCLLSCKYAGN